MTLALTANHQTSRHQQLSNLQVSQMNALGATEKTLQTFALHSHQQSLLSIPTLLISFSLVYK